MGVKLGLPHTVRELKNWYRKKELQDIWKDSIMRVFMYGLFAE